MFNDTVLFIISIAVFCIAMSVLYIIIRGFGGLKVEQRYELMEYKLDAIKDFVLAAVKKEALKLPVGDPLRKWADEWITIDENGSHHLNYRGGTESGPAIRNSAASDSVKRFVDAALALLDEIDQQYWIDTVHFDPFVNFVNNRQDILVNHQEIINAYRAIITCTTKNGVNDIKWGMINLFLG